MFFIRTTLLLGLGVLVLPTDENSQARVYDGAKTAVHWTSTFCDRNAEACVQGHQAWGVFVKKAEFGAKMALNLITEQGRDARAQASPPPGFAHGQPIASRTPAPAVSPKRAAVTLPAADTDATQRHKAARAGG